MVKKLTESNSSVGKGGVPPVTTDDTKAHVVSPSYADDALSADEVSAIARKVILKFDFLLVLPILTTLYLLSFIDRVNIGNARVAGLQKDLNMTDFQYSLTLTMTFIPYIIVEIPAALVVKRIGANNLLPVMATLWGLITTLQGLVTSYSGLLASRFFLGLVEGGLIPGIVLVMSQFYKRDQVQLRLAVFFTAASLTGAFSGLLASAILGMDGRAGHKGWQWIFILEGSFTVAIGLLSFFLIPQTPTSSRFLTQKEKDAINAVLKQDWTPDSEEEAFSWRQVIAAFKTPHVLMTSVMYFLSGNMIFSLAYFAPTIIRSMGYSPVRTQLMSVPPYATTFVCSVGVAILSDRWGQRGYSILVSGVLAMVGYTIFLTSTRTPVLYGSIFLQTMGAFTSAPAIGTWNINNVQPHYKRSTSIALSLAMANCGGILSTWIFDDPPRFKKAAKVNLAFSLGLCVLAIINRVWLVGQNKKKQAERAQRQPLGSEKEEEAERRRLGDNHPDFIYRL